MQYARTFFIAVMLVIGMASNAVAQQQDEAIGKVSKIEKAAVAIQDALPRPLAVGAEIQLGDIISTGKGARLEFTLKDGTVVKLGERSQFVVLEYVMNQNGGNAVMRMLEGAFAVTSGKMMQVADAKMTIQTEAATIGIRGTTVWGGVLDKEFEVAMLEGHSIVVETKGGSVVIDKKGDGTRIVSKDKAPTAPRQWSDDKIDRATDTVRFSN